MVSDAVAEKLEKAGLWRRAAAQWLTVMEQCDTDAQREWVSQKRRQCYSNIALPVSEQLNISALNRAANQAQDKMGIRQPSGAAFRIKPQKHGDK
ncbi:TPA: PerC family transcriptional regulator [Salmonella enterica]|nr:PerC family transcriptional regulator [Salmonella enterica]MCH5735966.1 PerC family transcriptional regulator [Salmonella enterica]MCH5741767.1 PerC family transcriptional regulator [Salmonella enterica]MCH5745689.1 PerC family transcriptional regulator [Salmonella enterica]MCH5755317.1 PerC family transcriptional regulator [Salmonella enterica]